MIMSKPEVSSKFDEEEGKQRYHQIILYRFQQYVSLHIFNPFN